MDPTCNEAIVGKEKFRRKRTKDIIKRIQKQFQFYFGDANLRHDRFLRNEIASSATGYIKLDVVASFNKMTEISTNRELIIKAVKKMELLELDETEQHMRLASHTLPPMINTDAQTVYVERLPPYADHDWLMDIFSTCGHVDYISLPRFRSTGMIKGFAFVEYATKGAATTACKELSCDLPRSKKVTNEVVLKEKESPAENDGTANQANNSSMTLEGTQDSKRKRSNGTEGDDQSKAKREKLDPEDDGKVSIQTEQGTTEESEVTGDEDNGKSSKKRKRKRKRKIKDEKELRLPPLLVITKSDWLSKKLMYKNLQRSGTTQSKTEIVAPKETPAENNLNKPSNMDKPMIVPVAKGTVVKLTTSSGCLTKKQIKDLVSPVCRVAYLDFEDNETEGHLRLFDQECAATVLSFQSQNNEIWPFILTALTGEQEEAYHTKIAADRMRRFKEKKKKTRGIDKVNRKLLQSRTIDVGTVSDTKHTYFAE